LAREALARAGLPVEWHVRPGLGHGIDPGGQRMAGHFMARILYGSLTNSA
jgi:phospholipase/carboxylesterase